MTHLSRPYLYRMIIAVALISSTTGVVAETQMPNPSYKAALDLMLVDRVELSTDVRRSIVRELESILAEDLVDSGLELRLEFLNERQAAEALREGSKERPCCHVRVNLWPRDGEFLRLPETALGAVLLTADPEPEVAHVFFPVVAEILMGRRGAISGISSLVLGRALARVVAHEVVHAFDADARHGRHAHARTGVMQRGFSRDLLESSMPVHLDSSSIEGLVRGLETRHLRAQQEGRRSSWIFQSIDTGRLVAR